MRPGGSVLPVCNTRMMDEPTGNIGDVREEAVSLITALVHDDDDAVDFVLLRLGEWQLRALCVALAEFLVQQIRFISTLEGQDAAEAWSEALALSKHHQHGDGFDE